MFPHGASAGHFRYLHPARKFARFAEVKFYPPMKLNIIRLLFVVVGAVSISSCLPLAAGAAAGYVARDQGYRVQSPLTRD